MEIKYKLYPYPVLTFYSNDYSSGSFETSVNVIRDGYDLCINFSATLTCQSLQDCINQGTAKFVYHLECSQTGFRTVVQTDKLKEKYTLLSRTVNGKLQICPFIVAVDDLNSYTSPNFHEDYQGITFNIEAGCVMAVGKMVTVNISKDIDEIADTPSIFNISKNPDESCRQMLVDMSQRKIIIKLPINDFYSYKVLSSTPSAQHILNSLTVIPALVFVLEELKSLSIHERNEYSDTLWYKVLSKVLQTQFEFNIESEEFNSQNCLELAQKLINNPITDAFRFLTSSFGIAGGGDE